MNIAEKLDGLTIRASSPDGNIRSVLEGRTKLRLEFRPDGYRAYTERELEHQLSRLATLTWTSYRRGYTEIVTSAGLEVVFEPGDEWNSHDREYQKVRLEVEGRGESGDGTVRTRTQALLRWQFKIKDGTVKRLPEADFTRETLSAVRLAIKDYQSQSAELRQKYFGPGFAAGG